MNYEIAKYAKSALTFGDLFPYDGADNCIKPLNVDWSHQAARGVLADLQDRDGIKHGFHDVDVDIRIEIVDTLAAIIELAHKTRNEP